MRKLYGKIDRDLLYLTSIIALGLFALKVLG